MAAAEVFQYSGAALSMDKQNKIKNSKSYVQIHIILLTNYFFNLMHPQ